MGTASRRPARSIPRAEALETRQMLSLAGMLDPSFGGGTGSAVGLGVPGSGVANAVATQPDGKIVVAGVTTINSSTDDLTLVRLNADGTPDASFGTGGRRVLAESARGTGIGVASVLVQPDGKIVVAGQDTAPFTTPGGLPTTVLRDAVFRLNADGSLDAGFGSGGETALAEGNFALLPRYAAASIAPGGKIVLAGVAGLGTANQSVAAARLNADGTPDATFGVQGLAATPLVINGISQLMVSSVAVQADGKVVVGGSGVSFSSGTPVGQPGGVQDFEAAVVRFQANGSLDTSFGGGTAGGRLLIPANPANPTARGNSAVQGLAIQPDGKIVVGGAFGNGPDVVTRLNPDGTYDLAFGTFGQARVPNEFAGVENDLLVQRDGKIVLSGLIVPDTATGKVFGRLARFNADGSLDTTFGNSAVPGISTYSFGNLTSTPNAVTLDPGGKIVAAGYVYLPTTLPVQQFAVARVLGSTTLPANRQAPSDFDGDGRTDLAVDLTSAGELAYRPSSGGADVLIPFGAAGAGQTIPAAGDYSGSGRTEVAAYLTTPGLYAYRPAGGGPDVVQPFGTPGLGGSIPAPGDYDGDGKTDVAVYLPAIGSFGIRPSAGGPDRLIPFGAAGAGGSIPAPGDYDGDGRTDPAVYLPSAGELAYRPSSGGADVLVPFGTAGAGRTLPAPGDFDGDGRTDVAAYLVGPGLFAYRPSGGGPDAVTPFGRGGNGTVPVAGDYLGSGRDEVAIFDPTDALFAYRPVGGGPDVLVRFGAAGAGRSIPLAAPAGLIPALQGPPVGPGAATPASSSSRAVPSGPVAMARRVGRTVVAQATAPTPTRPA